MNIATSRFGPVAIEPGDVIQFPNGMIGMENSKSWVLLADAHNASLGWLQSTEHPELALAVVSPRRFVRDYRVRIARQELTPLGLEQIADAQVLVIVGRNENRTTLNLKAPLVFNLKNQRAAQVVAKDDQPLQHSIDQPPRTLKKSA